MQEVDHSIALSNFHLKLRLKLLQAKEEDLRNQIQDVQANNFELFERQNDIEYKLKLKIENDTQFYLNEIENLGNDEVFKENNRIEQRINELEDKVAEIKKKKQSYLVFYLTCLIGFLLGFQLFKIFSS